MTGSSLACVRATSSECLRVAASRNACSAPPTRKLHMALECCPVASPCSSRSGGTEPGRNAVLQPGAADEPTHRLAITEVRRTRHAYRARSGCSIRSDGPHRVCGWGRVARRSIRSQAAPGTGDSVPIVEGVRRSDATLAAQYAVSNNGTLVYVSGSLFERRELAFRDREGRIETLKVASAAYYAPRISPDGKWIAVEVSDGKAFNIFVYDTTSASSIRQLTLQGNNRYPVWSADRYARSLCLRSHGPVRHLVAAG